MSRKTQTLHLLNEPTSRLPGFLEQAWENRGAELMLTIARRPQKNWTRELNFARPLVLSTAPQFEMILWAPSDLNLSLPEEILDEQDYLLSEYVRLFEFLDADDFKDYKKRILHHIENQETLLWTQLVEPPELSRALRELSYEHRGLEKGLLALEKALDRATTSSLSAKDRERLDLDFYHLLEHHLEREARALYPATQLLLQGP